MAKKSTLDLSDVTLDNLIGDTPLDDDLDQDELDQNDDNDDDNQDDDIDDDQNDNDNDSDDDDSDTGDDDDSDNDDDNSDDQDDDDDEGDEEDEDSEDSVIAELTKHLGIELPEGEKFEDSVEGLKKFMETASEQIAYAQLQSVFEAVPDVQEYMNYRLNGGDPEQYLSAVKSTDYSSVEIKEENVSVQKQVIREDLKRQGFEDEEINEVLEDYEETGLLYKHSQKSQKRLVNQDKKRKEQMLEEQKAAAEEQRKKNAETWQKVQDTIQKGELQGVVIPKTERRKFFDWMSKPIDQQGNTARSKARGEMDMDTMLALEYLLYKKMNLNDLVTRKANTQNAQSLKDRLKTNGTSKRLPNSRTKAQRSTKLPDLKDLF